MKHQKLAEQIEKRKILICPICNENPRRENSKTCSMECGKKVYRRTEKSKAYQKIWRKVYRKTEKFKEYQKAYYQKPEVKIRQKEYMRKYFKENKEELKARQKAYRKTEKSKTWRREYYQKRKQTRNIIKVLEEFVEKDLLEKKKIKGEWQYRDSKKVRKLLKKGLTRQEIIKKLTGDL